MKVKDEPIKVRELIADLATEHGHPSTPDDIDYKFWENVDYEDTVITLVRRIVKLEEYIDLVSRTGRV